MYLQLDDKRKGSKACDQMKAFQSCDTKSGHKQHSQKLQVSQTGNEYPCQLIISDYQSEYSESLEWDVPKIHKKQPKNKLQRLLVRPKDIKINGLHIKGGYGHSSAIFKRPILQGTFFIEIRILPDLQVKYKPTQYPSSARVGICPVQYKNTEPLGCENNSIAYKSNGCFVHNREIIAQREPYGVRDVIGVLLRMGPAYKNPDPNNRRSDSSVSFYKNGSFIFEFADLKQIFYCFGISLYNYSQVEFLEDQHAGFQVPEGSRHYYNCLQQKIPYDDLASNKIFRIHK